MICTVEILIPETAGAVGQVDALAMCQSAAAQAKNYAENAAQWLTGEGEPAALSGVENQLYLNTANGDVWKKGAVSWVMIASLTTDLTPIETLAQQGVDDAATAQAAAEAAQADADANTAAITALGDALSYKGAIDCSANPNYPAADAGHVYKVSAAGKIGGASGPNVEIGDSLICTSDGSASGTQAAVGANWGIFQTNIDGAVIGPTSAASGRIATFNGATGKLIQDGGSAITDLLPASYLDTDTALAANSDTKIASQKAVKAYVDSKPGYTEWQTTTAFTRTGAGAGAVTDNAANQALFRPGRPLRALSGATYTYHIVTAYSAGAVTVAGPALPDTIDALAYGDTTRVEVKDLAPFNGYFADGADSALIEHDLLARIRWRKGKAYCVYFSVEPISDDSGAAQPRVNVTCNGNAVCTSNSNAGLAVNDADAVGTTTDISSANYSISWGQKIEVTVDANGTNDNAQNLTVIAVFVLE